MVRRVRLGVIVPSSNTVLEPLTSAIISSIDDPDLDISVHYSRFRVTTIDVSQDANAQFLLQPMLDAARLLADAEVHVIGWSGTSSGWLGFEKDEILCDAINEATGIPATSSVVALNELLIKCNNQDMGLVTPYAQRVNDAIRKNYASIGLNVTVDRERHLGLTKNMDFGKVTETQLDEMVTQVVEQGADVVAIYCTNLRGARRASAWEEELNIVVLDSVATTVWGMLRTIGVQPSCVKGWGSIFTLD
ncbi:Asp/Glu/hydantoin racemase [Exophiala viscosa]|uniref:Asp/Glu/hydantoin racemase n=1 Tax=Exophiala viscosa TaxID=2486360 RepID=A0AAN6DYG8_9EURO|nr:Asp/Glu/hydantoin racemase [Exophiala viscosa]KAI1619409.1 Asp/Glu/hydantoin racemase [Exophiala viscosa]